MPDVILPTLRHLFTLEAQLAPPLDAGEGPLGRRTLSAVAEGRFSGPRLRGCVNPGTGDWMLTRGDIRVVDARISLITDDGALIHMSYGGRLLFDREALTALADRSSRHLIDPSRYYFRTTPLFETGHAAYLWLNRIVSIGVGRLIAGGVAYDVFEVT
ncbi:DUF3237 domain-containing protein [Ottowia sp.]|uniref:DUF3237 domain-containing protein n=1 Tax=Ottowia sp. TaxID=1898956 RepID=UPI0039E5705E